MLDLLAHHLDRMVRPYAGTSLLPGIMPGNFNVDTHVETEDKQKVREHQINGVPALQIPKLPLLPKSSPSLGVFTADDGRVHAHAIGQAR